MKRIERISVINSFMTCIIVLYHCRVRFDPISVLDGHISDCISEVAETAAAIAMSCFFCISAFLLFRNLNKQNYLQKIKNRLYTLLVPYLIWQAVSLIIKFAVSGGISISDSLKSIFLFYDFPPDGPLWYLYAIFILSLLSPVLLLLFKNKRFGIVVLLAACLAIYGFISSDHFYKISHYGIVLNVFKYLISYLMGAYWGMHYRDLDDLSALKYIALPLTLAFIISVGFFKELSGFILCSAIPVLLLYFFPSKIYVLRNIPNISFIMYAVHQPLFSLYSRFLVMLFSYFGIYACFVNFATRVIGLLVTIVTSWVIYILLKRFAPPVLSLLTGGRAKIQ